MSKKFYFIFTVVSLCIATASVAQDTWVPCNGNALQFGRPSAMIARPNGEIFFGCDKDHPGVFRSSDYGQHWQRLPFNDWGYVLAAGSDGTLYGGGYYGLMLSRDNGNSWKNASPAHTKITGLAVLGAQTVYVAAGLTVHRSDDAGNTWTDVTSNLTLNGVISLMATPNAVYAGTLTGCYRSTNRGGTWTPISSLSKEQIDVLSHDRVGVLYAAGLGGLYVSIDDGLTWRHRGYPRETVFAITNDSSNTVCASTATGIYRSEDFGTTWHHIAGKDSSFKPYTSCIASDGESNLYVGVYSSADFSFVARSTDRGDTWPLSPDGGIAFSTVHDLFVDVDQALYASTSRGLYRTYTSGSTWEKLSVPTSDGVRKATVAHDGTLFAVGEQRGPYRSTDHGQSWNVTDNGLPPDTIDGRVYRDFRGLTCTQNGSIFVIDAHDAYTGSGGSLFRSTNNGESWDSVYSLRNFFIGRGVFRNIVGIGNYLYLGVDGNESVDTFAVYVSSDFGASWTPCGQPTWKYDAVVGRNPYTGSIMAGRLRSTDDGDSWVSRKSAMPNEPHIAGPGFLYCHQTDIHGNTLSYRSVDDGDSWTSMKVDSFPGIAVCLALDSSGNVYGGTNQKGVYRRVGAPLSVRTVQNASPSAVEVVTDHALLDGNGSSLEIYDMLGRRCYPLVDRTSRGWRVDVRQLPRGLYFSKDDDGSLHSFFVSSH